MEDGRFAAEDVIKGNGVMPGTLNRYGYCFNSPLDLVDQNGKDPLLLFLLIAGTTLLLSGCSQEMELIEIKEPVIEPQPPTPSPQPSSKPMLTDSFNEYIKVEDYNVRERGEFIEFMKYAESAGKYSGSLYDADGDGNEETIAYGHDTTQNGDKDFYIGKVLTEKEGEELLLEDLEKRIPFAWMLEVEEGGHCFTAYEIDALVSLNYATGALDEGESTNFAKLLKGAYTQRQVYDEFMTYDKNSVFGGLPKRHSAEARIFLLNIYDMEFYDKEIESCVQ